MRASFCLLLGLAAAVAWATPASVAGPLDRVADELDGLAADLAAAQAQTVELRDRLAGIEALTAEHQAVLAEQAALQARYAQAVADLEAHDRASLALAEDLQRRLEDERRLTGWLVPAAGALAVVVVVEAWFLTRR